MNEERIKKYYQINKSMWNVLMMILKNFDPNKTYIDRAIKDIAETGGKLKHPYASALAFLSTAEIIRLAYKGVKIDLAISYPDGKKQKLRLTNQAAEEELI